MGVIQSLPARCGMAVLSGAVYAMAYPPLGWGWLVFPGLCGLLLALGGQHGTRARPLGFLHGMTVRQTIRLRTIVCLTGGLGLRSLLQTKIYTTQNHR
jgi:hypothetical protein